MAIDVVKQIRKATLRRFTQEAKIQIVLDGLRGRISVTELCREEGNPDRGEAFALWGVVSLSGG